MASFDIIKAAADGYGRVYRERRYLMQLAAAPLLIKFLCFMIIIALGWDNQFLRQALIMLPAYFADGWMTAHFTRLIFLDQRWPFRPSGNPDTDREVLRDKARGITAGALVFALSRFLVAGMAQVSYQASIAMQGAAEEGVNGAAALGALVLVGAALWGFRFLWFYIPASLGYSLRRFYADMGGFMTSFPLIGCWLLCFLPVFTFFSFLALVTMAPYGIQPEAVPGVVNFALVLLRVLMDTVITLVASAGIAEGLRVLMAGRRSA